MGKRLNKAQARLKLRQDKEAEVQSKMLPQRKAARRMPGSMKK